MYTGHKVDKTISSQCEEHQLCSTEKLIKLSNDWGRQITQINGQRKTSPPPDWQGPPPDARCEIFVGKIPRDLYEDEIHPVFSQIGLIYEIRLMMDFSGSNRGYCFVMYTNEKDAQRAIDQFNNYEIRSGNKIGVVRSVNNCRLWVTRLPKDLNTHDFMQKVYSLTTNVKKIGVYRSINNDYPKHALLFYKTHMDAAMARRRLVPERGKFVGTTDIQIDWAHPGHVPQNVWEECGTIDPESKKLTIKKILVNNIFVDKQKPVYFKNYYQMNQNKYHFEGANNEKKNINKYTNYNTSLLAVKNQKWINDNKINKRHEINDNFDINYKADKYVKNNYNVQKQQSSKMYEKTLNGEFQNLSIQRNFDNANVVIREVDDTNSIGLSKSMDIHEAVNKNSMKFKQNFIVPHPHENKQIIYNGNWQHTPVSHGDVKFIGYDHNTIHTVNKIGNYCHQLQSNYPILYITNFQHQNNIQLNNFLNQNNNYINNTIDSNLIQQSSGPRPILNRLGNDYF